MSGGDHLLAATLTVPTWSVLPAWFRAAAGFAFGAATGSFLSLVVERLPRRVGISGLGTSPRSHCRCGRELAWWENLPIIGFVVLRGRARCCGARIPGSYFLLEMGTGSLWAVCWLLPSFTAALVASFVVAGIILSVGLFRSRKVVDEES
jgi:leader peptidase (prepilin peptidase) / N-methyltransferase